MRVIPLILRYMKIVLSFRSSLKNKFFLVLNEKDVMFKEKLYAIRNIIERYIHYVQRHDKSGFAKVSKIGIKLSIICIED